MRFKLYIIIILISIIQFKSYADCTDFNQEPCGAFCGEAQNLIDCYGAATTETEVQCNNACQGIPISTNSWMLIPLGTALGILGGLVYRRRKE